MGKTIPVENVKLVFGEKKVKIFDSRYKNISQYFLQMSLFGRCAVKMCAKGSAQYKNLKI